MSAELNQLKALALALVGIGATVLMGLAVITGFKDSGKVDNTTADVIVTSFVTLVGFLGVVVLAMIGKVVLKIFKN